AIGPLVADTELAVIFGGDGTILRAAEWALPLGVALLGVNMGHVGFLAELEAHETGHLVEMIHSRDYTVEERLTLNVTATAPDGQNWSSVAVNEVSVEKSARERMLEVLVNIDGLPLSRWSCDGVLVATPTGSTAYSFSAGGPILWPNLDSMLVVPVSAHALFSRPVVVGPSSVIEMELVDQFSPHGAIWCDGRRSTLLSAGSTVRVTQGTQRLRLARFSEQPFTSRLVRKFGLRIEGWRGAAEGQRSAN
ncbi:MAG: NAD kinase, partial [Propionibacteriaceae bacterium]